MAVPTTMTTELAVKATTAGASYVFLPNPQELSVSVQDVDYESGRNQSGYMFRDRVRGGASAVRKVEVKFPPLTMSQVSTVLQAVNGASMKVCYPDPYTGAYREGTFYVGDRKAPLYSKVGSAYMWTDVAFNFIEY